ncbi:MAG TPA: prolyl oligopeptidase family serine peptidase [Fimbriiglobus sp.]|nr:prolyl oligopeptidase family serine peptidase [Fimbriiglobus sp.]
MTFRALLPAGRPTGLAVVLGFAVCVLAVPADLTAQAPAAKRPLKHSDYEIWNSASGFRLAPDGTHLVYNFTPAKGDGAVVIRNVPTGTEHRIPSGGKAVAAKQTEPPAATSGLAQFTPDSKKIVLNLAPPRSAVDRASAAKTKPSDQPRTVLAVIDLATGKVTDRFEKARSFSVVGTGAGYLVAHKEPKAADRPKGKDQPKEPPEGPRRAGRRGFGGRGAGGPTPPRPTTGTDLVVRDLADGSETVIPDVAEFSVTKDHKQIVYAVLSKTAGRNGVYVAPLAAAADAIPVRTGPGRYFRLTWDEQQTQLAFFYAEPGQTPTPEPPPPKTDDGEDLDQQRPSPRPSGQTVPAPPLPPARVHVFVWSRTVKPLIARRPMAAVASAVAYTAPEGRTAAEVFGPDTPGLKTGYRVVDRGGLDFTADGRKLTVGVARVPDKPTDPAPTNPAGAVAGPAGRLVPTPRPDDRIDLDIWHWKDELVQPMQKVRRGGLGERNQRAVYFLDTRQARQLGDEDTTVLVPGHGDWALASSDKTYRGKQWLSPTPRDYALVNVRTGESKPLFRGYEGRLYRSPRGKCLVAFDGKHWHAQPCPDGKPINLTAKLKVKFASEDYDSPSVAPPYGLIGFTPDEKHVLLADRYDIWKVAVDGSGAENVTKIGRQLKTRFRPVRLDAEDRSDDQAIDLSKPMLLAAENLETYDSGYYRLEPGRAPKMLLMGARGYGLPTKAKHADVYLFTVQTFAVYPDYYVADKDFTEVKRVTDVNPRVREFNWGKAELVHYKSADGVPLKGVLVKPEDFDPAKKYPMIVYIYERLSQNLYTFRQPAAGTSINPTYYASNGYLVFMPDIAYTVGSPGQSAIKCVLPAIQEVVDLGFVKEDAIGIQGHSWGGYQIAYMVTQTNRFKAAAAGAPVSNMTSAYGGIRWGSGLPRQLQYERTQSRIGKTLWEAPMRYIENSPVFMADRVRTPLLILHNDQDDAVPWYQGIEYYLALRRLGKECYLLNYNGEPHGLRRKATQRDYTMRMQQFFDHHLKGAPAPEWMTKGVPFNERDKEKEQWKKLFEPVKK